MPLIQINADLKRVAEALERIADLLQQVLPPPQTQASDPVTEKDFHEVRYETHFGKTEEDIWESYGPRTNYR